jgi:hypothetical protein
MSTKTCLLLVVILKETLVLVFLASHFVIIESLKLFVGHRDIYYAKKYSILWYVWILEFL